VRISVLVCVHVITHHLSAVILFGSGWVEVGSSTSHCSTSYVNSSLPTRACARVRVRTYLCMRVFVFV